MGRSTARFTPRPDLRSRGANQRCWHPSGMQSHLLIRFRGYRFGPTLFASVPSPANRWHPYRGACCRNTRCSAAHLIHVLLVELDVRTAEHLDEQDESLASTFRRSRPRFGSVWTSVWIAHLRGCGDRSPRGQAAEPGQANLLSLKKIDQLDRREQRQLGSPSD